MNLQGQQEQNEKETDFDKKTCQSQTISLALYLQNMGYHNIFSLNDDLTLNPVELSRYLHK